MVYLICQGYDCVAMTGQYDAPNAREARQIARSVGWTRTKDGRDLCEVCTVAERDGVRLYR